MRGLRTLVGVSLQAICPTFAGSVLLLSVALVVIWITTLVVILIEPGETADDQIGVLPSSIYTTAWVWVPRDSGERFLDRYEGGRYFPSCETLVGAIGSVPPLDPSTPTIQLPCVLRTVLGS